jgi:hypothetical protein
VAGDVNPQIAVLDHVVGVRDDEDLTELCTGDGVQLFKQRAPAVGVLAAEHLVNQYESGLGAALARKRADSARRRQSPARSCSPPEKRRSGWTWSASMISSW